MLPLSLSEFLYFHDFKVKDRKSALGGTRTQVYDKNGERYELLRRGYDVAIGKGDNAEVDFIATKTDEENSQFNL